MAAEGGGGVVGFWDTRDGTVYSETQGRHAPQKGLPSMLVKKEKKLSKDEKAKAFRDAVWTRDQGKSRASGKKLSRTAMDWDRRGEVHHRLKRSTNPDAVYDVGNGILLSKSEHVLAETRCPNAIEFYLLDISGPDDLKDPQQFTFRDIHGTVTKVRHG